MKKYRWYRKLIQYKEKRRKKMKLFMICCPEKTIVNISIGVILGFFPPSAIMHNTFSAHKICRI